MLPLTCPLNLQLKVIIPDHHTIMDTALVGARTYQKYQKKLKKSHGTPLKKKKSYLLAGQKVGNIWDLHEGLKILHEICNTIFWPTTKSSAIIMIVR